jgi:hypothetical protein
MICNVCSYTAPDEEFESADPECKLFGHKYCRGCGAQLNHETGEFEPVLELCTICEYEGPIDEFYIGDDDDLMCPRCCGIYCSGCGEYHDYDEVEPMTAYERWKFSQPAICSYCGEIAVEHPNPQTIKDGFHAWHDECMAKRKAELAEEFEPGERPDVDRLLDREPPE